ncbi:MAG: hypothetical protein WDN26_11300 [Chitinophagaceae bacterium]
MNNPIEQEYITLELFKNSGETNDVEKIKDAALHTGYFNHFDDFSVILNACFNKNWLSGKWGFPIKLTPAGNQAMKEFEAVQTEHKHQVDMTKKKLRFDFLIAKRVYQSYWITFFAAITALVISVVLLVLKLTGQ